MIGKTWGYTALCVAVVAALAGRADAILLDFETEDDFATALINGQSVDPAFDNADLEFGNLVNVSSTQIGGGSGHLGVAVFDSDDDGPNASGGDQDLIVNLGNILILQNDESPATANDTPEGLRYTTPNDEASFDDRGSILFTFLSPSELTSIDLVDINGGVEVTVTLTDTNNKTRVYDVPQQWTTDPTVSPTGFQTLLLNTLANQPSEPNATGGDATASEDLGFDPTQVVTLDVLFGGPSPSGGLDNLEFIPEPSSFALLALGGLGLIRRRR